MAWPVPSRGASRLDGRGWVKAHPVGEAPVTWGPTYQYSSELGFITAVGRFWVQHLFFFLFFFDFVLNSYM